MRRKLRGSEDVSAGVTSMIPLGSSFEAGFVQRKTNETSFGLEPAQGHNGVREDGPFFLSLPARRYRVG